MLKYYIYNCCLTERMLMSITLVALKIWPPFPTFSLSSDNLCFKQVEERASLFTSSLIPINFLKMLAQHLRRHQVSRKIRRNKMNTGSRDSTNPRLIVQFRELRIDVHQMSIHPVKISVFIKPLKIKESRWGRSKMPEGRWVVVGGQGRVWESVCVKLSYPIVLCCDDPESAGTRQWSAPGGWSSLITRPV